MDRFELIEPIGIIPLSKYSGIVVLERTNSFLTWLFERGNEVEEIHTSQIKQELKDKTLREYILYHHKGRTQMFYLDKFVSIEEIKPHS